MVLDPFMGLGTTMLAAMAAGRNCVGFEIDRHFEEMIVQQVGSIVKFSNKYIHERLKRHELFVADRQKEKGPLKYVNRHYGFPVMMNQEKNLFINGLVSA